MYCNQFFNACIGAGMRPPRWIITAGLYWLMGMMGGVAQQAAKVQNIAGLVANGGDHAHSGGLAVDHADGGFVGDEGADDGRGGVAGMMTMSMPTEQTAVMASSFQWSGSRSRRHGSCRRPR